jgi:hypothetical protein
VEADVSQEPTRIEPILQGLIATAEQAEHVTRTVARKLVRIRALAEQGDLLNAAPALDALSELTKELVALTDSMNQSFPADPAAYMGSGAYQRELLAAAVAAGLAVFEDDDRLLCPPAVIRVLPAELALEIDGQREHRLRPSVVVTMLAERQRRPRFHPAGFLNSLREAYDFVLSRNGGRRDAVARLVDIWHVLTLLPGREREYTKREFTRDLYLLDNAGSVNTLQSERQLRWCASSGTRGQGILDTIDSDGRQRYYWGIAFVRPVTAEHTGQSGVGQRLPAATGART